MSNDVPDQRQNRKLIKTIAVSSTVLLSALVLATFLMVRSFNSWQSNPYWAVDINRSMRQACGLEGNDLKDLNKNQNTYYAGVMHFLDGVMADRAHSTQHAIACYQDALDQFEIYPGWNNIYAFDALNRMGEDLDQSGHVKEAEKAYKDALDCAQKFSGRKSYLVSHSLGFLGTFYHNHGRYAESRDAFKSALEVDRAGLGENHNNIEYDYWWLASAQHGMKRTDDALRSLDSALRVAKLNKNLDDVAKLTLYRGVYLFELERYAEAEVALSDAAELFHSHPDDLQYYHSRIRLAHAMLRNGKTERADAVAQSAIPEPGKISSRVDRIAIYKRAGYYFSRAKYELAEPLFRNALSVSEQEYTRNNLSNVSALLGLADCLRKQRKVGECAEMYKRMLEVYDKNARDPSYQLLSDSAEVFREANQLALARATEIRAQRAKLRSEPSRS